MSSKITPFSTQPHGLTPAQIAQEQEYDYCYQTARCEAKIVHKTVMQLLNTQVEPQSKLRITTNFAFFTKQRIGNCLEEIEDSASSIGMSFSASLIELRKNLVWHANDPMHLLRQIKPFTAFFNSKIAALTGTSQEKANNSYLLLKQLYSVLEDAHSLTEHSASSNQQKKVEQVFLSAQAPSSSIFLAVDRSLNDDFFASVLPAPTQSPSALPVSTPSVPTVPLQAVNSGFDLLREELKKHGKEKSKLHALETALNSLQQQFEDAFTISPVSTSSLSHSLQKPATPPLPPSPDLFRHRKGRVMEIMGRIESAVSSINLTADERLVRTLQEVRTLEEKVNLWMKGMQKHSLVESPEYFEDRENSPENINEWFNNFKKHVKELLDAKPTVTYTHLFVLQSDIKEFLDLPDIHKATKKLVFNNGKLPSIL